MNAIDTILTDLNLNGFDGQGGTDKGTTHTYTAVYDRLFAPRRHEPLHLMEIGIYHGGSAALWCKYFPNATFTFVDTHDQIGPKALEHIDMSRSLLLWRDAYSDPQMHRYIDGIDIFIDDGPHTPWSQQVAIQLYSPYMRPGGIMVIEDIAAAEWVDLLLKEVPPGVSHELYEGNTHERHDDRMLILTWPRTTSASTDEAR